MKIEILSSINMNHPPCKACHDHTSAQYIAHIKWLIPANARKERDSILSKKTKNLVRRGPARRRRRRVASLVLMNNWCGAVQDSYLPSLRDDLDLEDLDKSKSYVNTVICV